MVRFSQYLDWGWQIQLPRSQGVRVVTPGDSAGPVFKLASNPDKVLAGGTTNGQCKRLPATRCRCTSRLTRAVWGPHDPK